jgi:hypothetical protein
MDTLLEFLQDCQKKALSKGIDCSVDICFNSKKEAVGNIKMMYVSTTGIQESFLFETTVSESFTSSTNSGRINRAYHFISSITDYKEE